MWGSKLGWWIAEILVAMVAVIAGATAYALQLTPPTALTNNAVCMKELKWPIDPAAMVRMDEPGDAGPLYWKAIAAWDRDMFITREYGNVDPVTKKYKALPPLPEAFLLCIKATHMKDGTIFGQQPADLDPAVAKIQKRFIQDMRTFHVHDVPELVINYAPRRTALLELDGIGIRLNLWGIRELTDGHKENARILLEASFALGAKMARERLIYEELSYGQAMMSESAYELARLEGDDTPAGLQWQKFDEARKNVMVDQIMKPHDIISQQGDNAMVDDIGDMFNLALHSKERVLRIEATLKLGWYKYNTGYHKHVSGADYLGQERIINLLLRDPDPYVRKAAWHAKYLTADIYRMIGTSWDPID